MVWVAVGLGAVLAGLVQTVTGFGSGVVLILILSRFFDMLAAPGINNTVSLFLAVILAWQYRGHINVKKVLLPGIPFVAVSMFTIRMVRSVDLSLLGIVFGFFLIALSVYFFCFDKKIKLHADVPTAVTCAVISGVFSGLFGVGGPLMALYFLQVTENREEYVGSLQLLFVMGNVLNTATRICSGIYTPDLLPITLVGAVGVFAGKQLGNRIAGRLNAETMKKVVYLFVGISGVINLVQELV